MIANDSYEHYWKHGSTSHDPAVLAKTTHPNPSFVYQGAGSSTLHYGMDPLQGFHLTTAFAPLTKGSHLELGSSNKPTFIKVLEAAQLQFQVWCKPLRLLSANSLTIRFFAGDAIAFAFALQHVAATGVGKSPNIYPDYFHLEALSLDHEDYISTKRAPLEFAVIDTSNLIDHLGAVIVLSATSPLLRNELSSSIYTKSLVKREQSYKAYVDLLLCGDFSTMSLILNLFPTEHWTNASSSFSADESIFETDLRSTSTSNEGQMRVRLTWKRPLSIRNANEVMADRKLRFDECDFAHVLHKAYQNMFKNEDVPSLLSNLNTQAMCKNSQLHYHRGSFGIFLAVVRSRVVVDWRTVMEQTVQLIDSDSNIMTGHNYLQEVYLSLHTLNLYSAGTFLRPDLVTARNANGVGAWKDFPKVVCITIKVPFPALAKLTGLNPVEVGSPIAHYSVQSSPNAEGGRWQNVFAAIQITFGTIITLGTPFSNNFLINVAEDEERWNGSSPLLASFKVPSWFLLQEPRTAIVAFGLQSTPFSANKFAKSLGLNMNIHETTLGNDENVYITRHSPNLTGFASVHGFSFRGHELYTPSNPEIGITMTTIVARCSVRITFLTGCINFYSDSLKEILQSGAGFNVTPTAHCEFDISTKDCKTCMSLEFLTPVVGDKSKTRIARKSSYVEVEAPIHTNTWISFPSFISPLFRDRTTVILSNMDMLPVLDMIRQSQLQWVNTHISGMWSSRERTLREQSMSAIYSSSSDTRVSFKDSIFSLFMHFGGLEGGQGRIFGLRNLTRGGVNILIFVYAMKLDIGSQTVVLDTAILPFTKSLVPRIKMFLGEILKKKFGLVNVDDEELMLWRQILPSFSERCRTWQHLPSCNYAGSEGRLTRDTNGKFCLCGHGILLNGFMTGIPRWSDVARYTTRAAISPIFSVPVVDAPFDVMQSSRRPS